MQRVVVWGGGELGATLVRRLAEERLAREVVLVEADEGRARGKALDLLQSGPVEGYDTHVVGAGSLEAAGAAEVVVAADAPELEGDGLKAVADRLVSVTGNGTLLVAGPDPAALLEHVVGRGLARERAIGTAPVAEAASVRRALADELRLEPSQVALSLIGAPGSWIVPQGSVVAGGLPVDETAPLAVRRALAEAMRKKRGPVALAAAAARVVRALQGARDTLLDVALVLSGELGRRGSALAVPARIGGGRVRQVVEPPLMPVDRIALDNAGRRRSGAA
jgi:malate dehydrogenase